MAVMITKELDEAAIRDDRKNKRAGRQDRRPAHGSCTQPEGFRPITAARVSAPRRYAARS